MNFSPITVGLLSRAVRLSHEPRTQWPDALSSCLFSLARIVGSEEAFALGGLLGEEMAVHVGAKLPAWMRPIMMEEEWPAEYFSVRPSGDTNG